MHRLTQHLKKILRPVSRPAALQARPQLEALENRLLLYSVSGDAWPHPQLIRLSFEPDGTNLGGATSNLFATFNAKFGSAANWENQILKAAQAWAQQTNINFTVVPDNGSSTGSGSDEQGNPGFGNIRIGGFNFGSSALGMTYMPPQDNNYSVAGNIAFNTAEPFNVGSSYDLFTVAVHEIGHALGLYHSNTTAAVMYPNYMGTRTGLSSDDIAGIRSIYSNGNPRSTDTYTVSTANSSFSAAADITTQINTTSKTALLTNLDIATTSQKEYYKFTAPAGSSGTLTVTVQSSGLSLLAPALTVYNSGQTPLATVSGTGYSGSTLTLSINGITAGAVYYLEVTGANTTAFGTGNYALTLNLGNGPSPTVPLPNTQTPNGNPVSGSGGQAYNPLTIQAVLSGLLNSLTGILKDGAGTFDLLETPVTNASPYSHLPGCACPICLQAHLRLAMAATENPQFGATSDAAGQLAVEVNALHATVSAPSALVNPRPAPSPGLAPANSFDPRSISLALTTSQRDSSTPWWPQVCDAYFADPS